MKAFISTLSHEPIKVDITSVSDSMRQYAQTGYRVSFELITRRFRLEGNFEIHEYPLTEQELEKKLLAGLEEDLLEASAEGITGIIK